MQFKEKLMSEAWENGKKKILGPTLACLAQILQLKVFANFATKECYLCLLSKIVSSCYTMQVKEKLTSHTWENSEKPNFGPSFHQFRSIFLVGFTSTSCQALLQPIILGNELMN